MTEYVKPLTYYWIDKTDYEYAPQNRSLRTLLALIEQELGVAHDNVRYRRLAT